MPGRALTGLALAALLTGCLPAAHGPYYRPAYLDDGATRVQYSGDTCSGAAGPSVAMRVELAPGVALRVGSVAARDVPGERQLTLGLEVADGVRMRFLGDEATLVVDGQPARMIRMPSFRISAVRAPPADAVVEMRRIAPTPDLFAEGRPAPEGFELRAGMFANLPGFVPASFDVVLPAVIRGAPAVAGPAAGGAPASSDPGGLPALRLEAFDRPEVFPRQFAGTRSIVYLEPGERARREARRLECARMDSREALACQRALAASSDGFGFEREGVRYTGRWYVHDTRLGSPFRGEMTIAHAITGPWRIEPAALRLREAGGAHAGRLVEQPVERLRLSLEYRAPFDASFVGSATPSPAGPKASTRLELTPALALPGGAARYRLELPDLSVDGAMVRLRPIELERRSLDVGVLPFNC